MSEKKELLLVVEEGTGRQLIGEKIEMSEDTVILGHPLLILERVMQPQQQQQQQMEGQQIMLNISPLMHTFIIDTWKFKWSGFHEVNDEKLKSTYEDFLTQIRASRSNISLSPSMPGLKPHLA